MNYTLIGMPASGKSTIGVILAKKLGYEFIDSDIVIQRETGKKLSTLIKELGIEEFLKLEDSINSSIDAQNTIISTGGSAVYGENAMKHFQDIGEIIYLRTNFEALSERILDMDKRGVVHKAQQSLKDVYKERGILYKKYATIVVDLDNKSLDESIDLIYDKITRGNKNGR